MSGCCCVLVALATLVATTTAGCVSVVSTSSDAIAAQAEPPMSARVREMLESTERTPASQAGDWVAALTGEVGDALAWASGELEHTVSVPAPPVSLYVGTCAGGSHYTPETRQVSHCYDQLERIDTRLATRFAWTPEVRARIALDAWRWSLLHELAHAVLDARAFPVLAEGEAAADAVATLAAIEIGDVAAARGAATYFLAASSEPSAGPDAHMEPARRAALIACLLVGAGELRPESAVALRLDVARCSAEYATAAEVWERTR
ncbi:MAG: hypothetical protein H6700_01750 [Myxococcales bacterium]|nr:hypothetical protein [Myxococcales bacterium]MCB9519780.1 hypothetical protein [Myxococcales bacterium]MCB9530471.1 hypothetical protein [Myxococcales bacterium]